MFPPGAASWLPRPASRHAAACMISCVCVCIYIYIYVCVCVCVCVCVYICVCVCVYLCVCVCSFSWPATQVEIFSCYGTNDNYYFEQMPHESKTYFAHKYVLFLSPSICNKLYAWCLLLQEYFDIARTTDYSIPLRNNKCQTISNHCIVLLLFVQKVEVCYAVVGIHLYLKGRNWEIWKLKTELWDVASLSALVLWVVSGLLYQLWLVGGLQWSIGGAIPYELHCNWTRVSTVRGQWLSSWTMTQPI